MPECQCCCGEKMSEQDMLKELAPIIDDYAVKPGGLIPMLQIVQNMMGYLPEAALKEISLRFKKPYSEVAGVVSFYSFFSTVPRGKYVVRVCLGTACYVRGGKDVLEALKKELGIDVGGTTGDRLFSLDIGRCFGACGLAPVIMVNDEVIQRAKPSKMSELLRSYRELEEDLTQENQQ